MALNAHLVEVAKTAVRSRGEVSGRGDTSRMDPYGTLHGCIENHDTNWPCGSKAATLCQPEYIQVTAANAAMKSAHTNPLRKYFMALPCSSLSLVWPKADISFCTAHVRFRG